MRIAQIDCDWKDEIPAAELAETIAAVGGEETFTYDVKQDQVDSKVVLVSSERLTDEQVQELWDKGDLYVSLRPFWEGTFEEIVAQVVYEIGEDCD